MMGMEVCVLEKREVFSRVNILTLWRQTADGESGCVVTHEPTS